MKNAAAVPLWEAAVFLLPFLHKNAYKTNFYKKVVEYLCS